MVLLLNTIYYLKPAASLYNVQQGFLLIAFEVDVDTQRTNLFDQHVERFWHASIDHVITFNEVFVDFGTSIYVIGLDCQHLLQDVRRAICFQRPNFHLTETLTTELCLTAQWLLSNQRIRTSRAGMHFIIKQMMQLENMHVTEG